VDFFLVVAVVVVVADVTVDVVMAVVMSSCLQIELDYATRRKSTKKMVVVVMEKGMRNPNDWDGILGADLGGLLYVRAWDDAKLEAAAEAILEHLYDMVDSLAIRCESRKATHLAYMGVCM